MFMLLFNQFIICSVYFSFEPDVIQCFNELEEIQTRMEECEFSIS